MIVRAGVSLLVAFSLFSAEAQEPFPVPVFVTHLETPLPPKMKPEQHAAAFKSSRDRMFEVAAGLRRQHGDRTNQWPPEVWTIFNAAEDEHMMTVARRDYEGPETQLALRDSVEDVLRGAKHKEMVVVQSAEEAALVIQITGRRRGPVNSDAFDNRYFVRFRLAPGGLMSEERFMELTRDYKWSDAFTQVFARPKEGAVYLDLEAGTPVSLRNASGTARATVLRFIASRMDPRKRK